ncbi:unnamed protein product [Polarella glacialis]|uniref:Uncharacterized protein n=1 Tax=Polarella glacialis TaxID=89957 RepID=A0A813J878_POLGL|nr:unnamed protein product [Polarella glacialis]
MAATLPPRKEARPERRRGPEKNLALSRRFSSSSAAASLLAAAGCIAVASAGVTRWLLLPPCNGACFTQALSKSRSPESLGRSSEVPKARTRRSAAEKDESRDPEAAIVEARASSKSIEGGTLEVIGAASSRPSQLLYSPGLQSLLAILAKLKNARSGEGNALEAMLGNIPAALDAMGDEDNQEVPADMRADFDEAVESGPTLVAAASEGAGPDGDWRGPLRAFSRLRLAQRLPEVADRLVPWDILFPRSLADECSIPQDEIQNAFRRFAAEINLGELSSWSEQELDEVGDLIGRNALLEEVVDALIETFEGTLTKASTAFCVGAGPSRSRHGSGCFRPACRPRAGLRSLLRMLWWWRWYTGAHGCRESASLQAERLKLKKQNACLTM